MNVCGRFDLIHGLLVVVGIKLDTLTLLASAIGGLGMDFFVQLYYMCSSVDTRYVEFLFVSIKFIIIIKSPLVLWESKNSCL